MYEKLTQVSDSFNKESEPISEDRKALLNELSIYIKGKLASKKEVNLIFICTHNSRRSHMAQIWAQAAASYYGINGIKTFSGGTQKTNFNPSAISALKTAGFKISISKKGKNPKYKVKFARKADPLICFSKVYDHKKNPQNDFVAIMTCSDADEACPVVKGADYRTTLKFEDPKKFDGTDLEDKAYNERSMQIGREMYYVFGKVASLLNS